MMGMIGSPHVSSDHTVRRFALDWAERREHS